MATGLTIMASSVFIFGRSNEAAMQAVALIGFFSIFAVFHFLDERAKRRYKERAQ